MMYGALAIAALFALGFGYFVLAAAGKEAKGTKLVGQIIAWIIIIASASALVCTVYAHLAYGGKGYGRMMGPGMMGPGMMKPGYMMEKGDWKKMHQKWLKESEEGTREK